MRKYIFIPRIKCSSSSKQFTVQNNAAVYTPNAMAIGSDGTIGSYVLYFTMKDAHHPAKAVYQYGRYVISSDNSLALTFTVLNAADYAPLEGETILNCKIDDGVKIFVK